jgi:RHS repeat-associated protein
MSAATSGLILLPADASVKHRSWEHIVPMCIAGVTTKANAAGPVVTLASGVLYREFGPLRQLTYGNNLILAKHYSTDYRLDVLRVRKGDGTNIVHRAHSYADGINLTRVVESVSGRNEDYTYDPANRLATAAGPWGGTLSYSYDLVGNRTAEVFSATPGYSHTYSYPSDSNRLTSVTDGATAVRSFTYDAAGNITIDNRSGTNNRYFYNDRGRLKQYRLGNTVRANYRYDFFERINWRETLNMSPTGATHYVQDLQGRLIYEATATGTALREYIWLDDMPLAVFSDLDTTPQLYFVHPDHLDRPLRMTDSTQAVVWDAVYRPFGEPVSITGTATLNLRFPGQYFLIESGLAYNWYRHYDPTIGRYTQSDPIAENSFAMLDKNASPFSRSLPAAPVMSSFSQRQDAAMPLAFQDGPSVYAYALSAPTRNIDPEGRAAAVVVPPIILCLRFPALCAAMVKAASDACIASYRAIAGDGGDEQERCRIAHKLCHDRCVDYAMDHPVGGSRGSDRPAHYRRCMRQCMADADCPYD